MRKRAFTLIEILVVMGIIAVLIGLLILGFGHASRSTHQNATQTTLQTLRGMVTEYEASGGTTDKLESKIYSGPIAAPKPDEFFNVGSPSESPFFLQTRKVLDVLTAVPANKKILDSLPPNNVKHDKNGTLLLDARGNPIVYVPTNGITGVTVGGAAVNVTNPDKRHGFFYSAGEDGNFQNGDDNIASFGQ